MVPQKAPAIWGKQNWPPSCKENGMFANKRNLKINHCSVAVPVFLGLELPFSRAKPSLVPNHRRSVKPRLLASTLTWCRRVWRATLQMNLQRACAPAPFWRSVYLENLQAKSGDLVCKDTLAWRSLLALLEYMQHNKQSETNYILTSKATGGRFLECYEFFQRSWFILFQIPFPCAKLSSGSWTASLTPV